MTFAIRGRNSDSDGGGDGDGLNPFPSELLKWLPQSSRGRGLVIKLRPRGKFWRRAVHLHFALVTECER